MIDLEMIEVEPDTLDEPPGFRYGSVERLTCAARTVSGHWISCAIPKVYAQDEGARA